MKFTYKNSGVDYNLLDPVKRIAQKEGLKTKLNIKTTGFKEISQSRGETAYILESSDCYYAFVQEGLGSKNLIADEMYKITGKTYYDFIGYDSVITIVMDLTSVGARPVVVLSYWAVGDSEWFGDEKRISDFIRGWRRACDDVGAVWGGGETPVLKDIINPKTIDLAGGAFGVIKPKNRLVLGDKLKAGDVIILFESSGIHVNGLTLARKLKDKLPYGFGTKLTNGRTYGEELLLPCKSYTKLVDDLYNNRIDIHYMVNITGHGWRKLMRAKKPFTYRIDYIPTISEIFQIIQKHADLSNQEMYATFNMGVGFAIMTDKKYVEQIQKISKKHKIRCWIGGKIENGPKQVMIQPKNIIYHEKDLKIR